MRWTFPTSTFFGNLNRQTPTAFATWSHCSVRSVRFWFSCEPSSGWPGEGAFEERIGSFKGTGDFPLFYAFWICHANIRAWSEASKAPIGRVHRRGRHLARLTPPRPVLLTHK